MVNTSNGSKNIFIVKAQLGIISNKYIYFTGNKNGDVRYGHTGNVRRAEPAVSTFPIKQKSVGAIESFTTEQPLSHEYKMYERNNIIASSKYATPRQVETIVTQKPIEDNDVYVQCAKPQVPTNSSPTHSISGSSQHSGSPRTSIAANSGPVYENIEHYPSRGVQQQYYNSVAGINLDPITYRKAQPQVPSGGNRGIRDLDCPPVYENVHSFPHKPGAMPGPQVPANTVYASNSPNYQYNPNQSVYSLMKSPSNTNRAQPQSPYSQTNFKSPSKTFTQQQIDEFNSGDYVCMSGNVAHTTLSTNTPFQTSSAKNYDRSIATGIAQTPTKTLPLKEEKKPSLPKIEMKPTPAPSPTPSATSIGSGKLKMMGKNLLPYSITPPKPRGPTEAEKKIEEMTRQIEEEMEKHEEEGEYFGKYYVLRI